MSYAKLLPTVVEAANQAGALLAEAFEVGHRPSSKAGMYEHGLSIERSSLRVIQAVLGEIVPAAGWFQQDEQAADELMRGAWWVVDGTEGAVNLVHGLPQWAATISLVVEGVPELAVVRQPLSGETWTGVRGGGAHRNGEPLRVSQKRDLEAAIVTASQAGNSAHTHARFGRAVATLLDQVLLVQNTIPTTFPVLTVAAGHTDAFFQYEPDLPGTIAGALLIAEAGGTTTDLSGRPWQPTAADVLFAAPHLHGGLLKALAS